MDSVHQAALTPDQLAAVKAGGGYARCEDPQTHVVYHLIQQSESPTIDDDYVREKLAEAYADIQNGRFAPWNVDEIKQELQKRLAAESSSR
jgi:hypothetical protein